MANRFEFSDGVYMDITDDLLRESEYFEKIYRSNVNVSNVIRLQVDGISKNVIDWLYIYTFISTYN